MTRRETTYDQAMQRVKFRFPDVASMSESIRNLLIHGEVDDIRFAVEKIMAVDSMIHNSANACKMITDEDDIERCLVEVEKMQEDAVERITEAIFPFCGK